jgi:phospholipid/cholesterol/gamma-HCH transport system substrate-binding protein
VRRDTVNYFAVGGFVLAGLIAFGALMLVLTGQRGPEDEYLVRYRNVTGIRAGTPVFYQGYRIGQVSAIDPEHEATGTRYRVTLAVQRDWPIPEDSIASAVATGLLADVSIAISEGKSASKLAPGAEIAGREGGDLFMAFNELATEVQALTRNSVRPLVDQLAATLGEGGPIVGDLRALMIKLNAGADGLAKVVGPDNQRQLSSLLHNMNAASTNASKLSAELLDTRQRLDAMLAQTEALVTESRPDAREAVRELRVSAQAIAERIDAVMEQLDATTRNMREFSREIRANPNRLLSGTPPEDEARK